MQIIELFDSKIHCPFCGAVIMDDEGLHVCPHVLFLATEYGPEYVRNDFPYKFGEEPIDEQSSETDTDEEDEKTYLDHIAEVDMKHAFCLATSDDFVFAVEGYYGFCQHTEEELKEMQEQSQRLQALRTES